jgi:hypothetical protein
LINYINFDKLDKYIKKNESYDFMLEYYLSDVENNETLQYKIYDYDNQNIIYLFDKLPNGSFFGEYPEHQLSYIDECKKEHERTTPYDTKKEQDEEWEDKFEDCLKLINDKFGFSDELIEKYPNEIRKFLAKNKSRIFNI